MGIDETLERRRGARIKAKGIYRDPVRSSRSHFIKASGLSWLGAILYKPAPPYKPGKAGRPRLKGARLPTLEQILQDPKTTWRKVTIRDWYGEKRRQIEIASRTAVGYHSGMPPLAIRWVLIRDPKGKFRPQALLCTDWPSFDTSCGKR
jgi:hypothetical protein